MNFETRLVQFPNNNYGHEVRFSGPSPQAAPFMVYRPIVKVHDQIISLSTVPQGASVSIVSIDSLRPCNDQVEVRLTEPEHVIVIPAFANVIITAPPGTVVLLEEKQSKDRIPENGSVPSLTRHANPFADLLYSREYIDSTCSQTFNRGLIAQQIGPALQYGTYNSSFVTVMGTSHRLPALDGPVEICPLFGKGTIVVERDGNVPDVCIDVEKSPVTVPAGEIYRIANVGGKVPFFARVIESARSVSRIPADHEVQLQR